MLSTLLTERGTGAAGRSTGSGARVNRNNTCFSTNTCAFTVHVGADPADQLPGGSVPP